MKPLRWFLAVAFTVILVVAAWLWWVRPKSTDMADYAPADALVYLECNSLLSVADGIASTDAWKEISPLLGTGGNQLPSRWLTRVVAWTGIGPIRSVILARAQLAAVMLDLGAKEEGETLTIRPEAAILIETHTAEFRIRSTVEEALKQFAEKSYRQPELKRVDVAGSEFLIWNAPTSERQIVATIDGTLVIVGNSERAVKTCLEVRRGQRPSLRDNTEMQQMRRNLSSADSLAFGYISSSNAARLFSLGAPLLFGRIPGDVRFDRIIGTSAGKVLAAVGWSSRMSSGGIEDRYLFSLQPALVSRLQKHFRPTSSVIRVLDSLPNNIHSVTIYRFENPATTWRELEAALSSQLDTLSAIVVSSLLKSALTQYGIEDPAKFLDLVGPELSTVRSTRETERSTIIAQVRDEPSLRQFLTGPSGRGLQLNSPGEAELIEIPNKGIGVSFLNGNVLIGPPAELPQFLKVPTGDPEGSHQIKKLEHFLSRANSANVVTYTRETEQVMKFAGAISRASGGPTGVRESNGLMLKAEKLPFAATETTLGDQGLERTTRSSFGQFATLVPLLFPER